MQQHPINGQNKILIVEDQFIEANNLQEMLEQAGYSISGIARSVSGALNMIDMDRPDMVLVDIFLKGPLTGIDLAKTLRQRNIPFIYLSANSNKQTLDAAKATRPYGFLVKPFRESDVITMMDIASYLHTNSLETQAYEDKQKSSSTSQPRLANIIGNSEKLRTVLHQVQLVAPTDTSVLVLGESGTGKEMIADSVHQFSRRKSQPLVKVNCAALPSELIDSMLFGHEKGAFTGAHEKRIGKFEQAHGGTIFLDEIGEICPLSQAKLLRVLQEKQVERIGGNETIRVNVRIIAATSRNLEQEVANGKFRLDLYYRLNVFPLTVPSLRERMDDIPLLAEHFAQVHANKTGKPIKGIEEKALKQLQQYHWPGNIRELEHCIERAVLQSDGTMIRQFKTPDSPATTQQGTTRIKTMEENEREHIINVLRACEGKIFGKGGAAEILGMNVSTLNFRIKKLGIDKEKILRSPG
ncbi:sigma-54 dependent transcriptional regulator [Paraflavitalea sp. CAU 1676]|uniref:sigma-54-dependent transcriptional regulator n=1 Tax=Paraflavitalea sp. CAU 1676 TaxID=3032598 RepID=UPI0023DBD885|nr:sigma-54 dependent transcriptional regulator [Paraflavitalea sp. CAU 1676]MDF2191670.1 sigma-54 dependent transcriptional regulator [Paraflavitalea sp. CAU 1676]